MSISTEEKDRYLRETAIVLAREGFQTVKTDTGKLRVLLDGAPLCEVTENGGITYRNEDITVGHVRMDFGRSGNEFWHTWWPRGPEELNSPAFKVELQEVVDTLRESVLKNRFAMERFCYEHGGKISGGWTQNYGYIVETEHYRYCLRCNPSPGDYNGYLTAYDLDVQRQNMARDKPLVGRVSYANGDAQEFTDADEFLRCVQEELPYRPTTGFRYEVLTDDPAVRKQVDDMIFDFYGEEAPCRQEDHEPRPEQGMTFGGM